MTEKLTCPECSHGHAIPAAGTKKIDCSGCGMILVVRKLLGEDWESRLSSPAPAAGAKKAPVIKSRRARHDEAKENGSAEEEAKPRGRRRTTRGSSRRPSRASSRASSREAEVEEEDGGRPSRRRAKKSDGPPMGLILSSVAAIVVAGVVGFFFFNQEDEVKDDGKKGQEVAEKTDGEEAAITDKTGAPADEETAAVKGDEGAGDGEKTAAVKTEEPGKKTAAKKKKSKRSAFEFVAFEVPEGVDEATAAKAAELIETMKDISKPRKVNQAAGSLARDMPRAAIPLLINTLWNLDYTSKEDAERGWSMVQALQTASERRDDYDGYWRDMMFEWKGPGDDGHESSVKWRKEDIKRWYKWWDKNQATWKPTPPEEG